MTTPSGAFWLRVQIGRNSVEFLIGPDLVELDSVVDTTAIITAHDGRTWQVRVMTASALISAVSHWHDGAGPEDLMTYPDLFVTSRPGVEAMSAALAKATADL